MLRIYKRIAVFKKNILESNRETTAVDEVCRLNIDAKGEACEDATEVSSVNIKRKREVTDTDEIDRKELQRKRQARIRGKDKDWIQQNELKKKKNVCIYDFSWDQF
jgi:hypothetical protein